MLAATVLLTGCGIGTHGTSAPDSGIFPVTITRSGGVAGVHDTITVRSDGTTTVRTASRELTCHAADTVVDGLRAGAGDLTGSSAPTTPAHPDAYVVTVSTPHGSARLGDVRLAAASQAVNTLLDDLALPDDQRTVCR